MNELQNVFTAVGSSPISLPQLVVVGSQSSGKSSVLEHIVGRDFLPRGTGIVTRRPLILQLNHIDGGGEEQHEAADEAGHADGVEQTEGKRKEARVAAANGKAARSAAASSSSPSSSSAAAASVGEEWGEFLHLPGQRFYDFNLIREEITRETDRVTGGGRCVISHQPMQLAIYSPHVLTLTLVDLPGATRVPVGDQPSDIGEQINSLILSYISSPHSLILAVSPATSDLANSDALRLAREVDPSGVRTLCVVTKIDLMDRGTDAMQVLNGNGGVELAYGFVGVVCRSQEAIQQKKTIREALQLERQFFAAHPTYRSISSRLGTPFLAKKLNTILMQQIQASLPEIRNKITQTLNETNLELESYGEKKGSGGREEEKGSILLPLISTYCAHLNEVLEGRSPDLSLSELSGGARISFIFRELFSEALSQLNPLDMLSDHDIRISIRNASGPRLSLFIPESCFELLVKKQIERLTQPSLDCIELVFHELQRVALQSELLSTQLIRFPFLRQRILEIVDNLLKSCIGPTRLHVESLIACELSFINTSHPDFIGGNAAVAMIMDKMNKMSANQKRKGSVNTTTPDGAASATSSSNTVPIDAAYLSKIAQSSSNVAVAHPQPIGHYSSHPRSSSASPFTSSTSSSSSSSLPPGRGFFASIFRSPPPPLSSTATDSTAATSKSDPAQPGSTASSTAKNSTATGIDAIQEHELYAGATASTLPGFALPASALAASSSPSFSSSSSSSSSSSASGISDRDQFEIELIKLLMQNYFNIIKKQISDAVPKAIMHFLVNTLKRQLQSLLVSELYRSELMDSLLREAEEIAEKRQACKELINILHRALEILNAARDFNAITNMGSNPSQ